MDAALLDLGGLRVLVPVDHVLVHRQVHQQVNVQLLPRLTERGEVLSSVAVEQELVGHDLEHRLPVGLQWGEAVLRQRGDDVVPCEQRIIELFSD